MVHLAALLLPLLVLQGSHAELQFREWWKAVKNTASCVRYVKQYSWTWLPSKNDDCNGVKCDFPKEICMSYTAEPTDLQCQKILPVCYTDSSVYFCPGRYQEYLECGPARPKSCETSTPSNDTSSCVPGCYCRDPWILVRSQRSVCVRKDHCGYFLDPELPTFDAARDAAPVSAAKRGSPSPFGDRRRSANDGPGALERAPALPQPRTSFSGEGSWGANAATNVPLYARRTATDPPLADGKCIAGSTEYPIGAELAERDGAGGAAWPFQLVRACATNAGGVPSWAAVACLDHRDRRVDVGQSFLDPSSDFLMKCDGAGESPADLRVRTASCVYQNDTFFPNGSAWTVGNIVRKCHLSPNGPGSAIRRMGCVDDFGDAVEGGDEFRTKDGLHMRRCLGPNGVDDWRTQIVACIDSSQNRRRCDQDYSIYARLKLAGYAKKLCRLCNSFAPSERNDPKERV